MTNSYETEEEKKKRLSAQLTDVNIDKGGVGAAGRVGYTLPLDKTSEIEAYADLEARKRKGEKMAFAAPMIGLGYTKRFKKQDARDYENEFAFHFTNLLSGAPKLMSFGIQSKYK